MLKQDEYIYFIPGTDFTYYGAPIPTLDSAGCTHKFPSKEDFAAVGETVHTLADGLYAGRLEYQLDVPRKNAGDNICKVWPTQEKLNEWNKSTSQFFHTRGYVASDCWRNGNCATLSDGIDSQLEQLMKWRIYDSQQTSVPLSLQFGEDQFNEEWFLLSTDISSVLTVPKGFPPYLSSYDQENPQWGSCWPQLRVVYGDSIRKFYYDMDKVGNCLVANSLVNDTGRTQHGDVTRRLNTVKPWTGNTTGYGLMWGMHALDGRTLSSVIDTYLSGRLDSQLVTEMPYVTGQEYPYPAAHSYYWRFEYEDTSRWREVPTRRPLQYHTYYDNSSIPIFVSSPFGTKAISQCYAYVTVYISWRDSYYGVTREAYAHKLIELEVDSKYSEDLDLWTFSDADDWSQTDVIGMQIVNAMKAKGLNPYAASMSIAERTLYLFRLDLDKYKTQGWNWKP